MKRNLQAGRVEARPFRLKNSDLPGASLHQDRYCKDGPPVSRRAKYLSVLLPAIIVLGAFATQAQDFGVRFESVQTTENQIVIKWVGRGGSTNLLLKSESLGAPFMPMATNVIPVGGIAPWFDVGMTSTVELAATSGFYKISCFIPAEAPSAPDILVPPAHVLDTLPIGWTGPAGAALYQLQTSPDPQFLTAVRETWPLGTFEPVTVQASGDYFSRVRGWNYYPESGGIHGPWSVVGSNRIFVSSAPAPVVLPSTTTNAHIHAGWTPVPYARIYQLQYTPSPGFTGNIAETWPGDPGDELFFGTDSTHFVRVRAWSDLPEIGGVTTAWSAPTTCSATVQLPPPTITNITMSDVYAVNVDWTDIDGCAIYELQISDEISFSSWAGYWPIQSYEFDAPTGSWNPVYARVRAWSALPEAGGVAGHWSATLTTP